MVWVVGKHGAGLETTIVVAVLVALSGCDSGSGSGRASSDGGDGGASATHPDGGDGNRVADAGEPPMDAGARRDAATDASIDTPDTGVDPPDSSMPAETPMSLYDTGLYADRSTAALATGVQPFTPRNALWSDGATKQRFLYLPPGTKIDVSNIDGWVFPVGTKAWKEFADGATRIETRLLEKRDEGWFMMAYAWNAQGTDARAVIDGIDNALGTQLDIPPASICIECHGGSTDALLGPSALQLGYAGASLSLADLEAGGLLSESPVQTTFALPGDATAQFALGYLNANCGHCHNPLSPNYGMAGEMNLHLGVEALATVEGTPAYTTTVGVDLHTELQGYARRIVAGQPAMSGLIARMTADKTEDHAMPPIATEIIDVAAVQTIESWISGLQ